uniref:Integrin alpha-6-like n=1 Tax=Gouania willdenowi TaxID=441366 RepID=A0A8C5GPN0_GOUWI
LLTLSAAVHLHLCALLPAAVLAFNLDTSHVIRKAGDPGSLFGFSLAMHRQISPDKVMLLIGAPRARALSRQKARVTGGLYRCDITQSTDCERIDFDNDEDVIVENKENQWMGVTVQSQGPGGKIVTCAHRYRRRLFVNTTQESQDITGRCYVLSQDLSIDSSSDEDGGNWNFCEGRARGHEMFGSCQQGLAATFTKDYHYVVFGAPGAYNWKGVVRVEQKNNTLLEMGIYDDGPYEVGDEHLLNPDLWPVPANSYLGFSLDSGHHITRNGGLTVVAGAPRANHSGAVVLLRKESEVSTKLVVEHILYGPGLGSSFGYALAVVNLNGDGWKDIIVGAPQFYMKDGDIGGAVYVYINKAGRWDKVTPVRLNGTKDSMFGLAVQNIGDINQDSYEDIAVGAPHDDAANGKVYIYHGSSQGIRTSPAQILSGKDHNIQFFGYSLAGNMDVDGNSYPDLSVGSLSDTAFIYRARPVVRIRRNIQISPQEIDLTVKTCANPASYSPRLSGYQPKTFLILKSEKKQGLTSRVMFLNKSHSESEHQFNGTLDLRGQNQEACVKLKAQLKENIKDKMRSIPIEVSAQIIGTKRLKPKNGLPLLTPILDSSQPSKQVTEVNFVKEGCGKDHVCRSNLRMKYSLYYKPNNLHQYFPLNKSKENFPEFHLNYEKKDLAIRVTVTNINGDDAYEAKLVANFFDIVSYSGVRSHRTTTEKAIICESNQNGSQAECELGNPFKRDSETTFYIILSTAGVSLTTTGIELDLTSVQDITTPTRVKTSVIIELPLSVSGEAVPSQVSFGGVVKGESAMKTEEEIGSLITYTFRINNLWKTLEPFVQASLLIHWPKWNKDGKWLLYLVKITSQGPENIVCSPETEISSLKHIQVFLFKMHSLREQASFTGCVCFKEMGNENRCVVFKCPLQGFNGASLELRSRLWNSTFLEVTVAVSPDSAVAQLGGVPWWIILVAVLAGILILALLVFLLWKCGFFKRATKDQYDAAYHKAEIHVQPSDKDKLSAEA